MNVSMSVLLWRTSCLTLKSSRHFRFKLTEICFFLLLCRKFKQQSKALTKQSVYQIFCGNFFCNLTIVGLIKDFLFLHHVTSFLFFFHTDCGRLLFLSGAWLMKDETFVSENVAITLAFTRCMYAVCVYDMDINCIFVRR